MGETDHLGFSFVNQSVQSLSAPPCARAPSPPSILSSVGSANREREQSRRVEKVVGYPPLSEMGDYRRPEFHAALDRPCTQRHGCVNLRIRRFGSMSGALFCRM
jgi:hypothetical protein